MNIDEKTLRLDEYKKIREVLMREPNFDQDTNQTNSIDNQKIMSLNNGHYKESKSTNEYYNYKKAGMVSVLMLSVMTFVFESLFLFLSFMIYK